MAWRPEPVAADPAVCWCGAPARGWVDGGRDEIEHVCRQCSRMHCELRRYLAVKAERFGTSVGPN